MKVTIVGRPEFGVEFDVKSARIVTLLMILSEQHYDGVCKSASKPNGFLYGWNNQVSEEFGKVEWPVTIWMTWREADLTLKIMEVAQYAEFDDKTDLGLIFEYQKSLGKAMEVSRKQEWKVEVQNGA